MCNIGWIAHQTTPTRYIDFVYEATIAHSCIIRIIQRRCVCARLFHNANSNNELVARICTLYKCSFFSLFCLLQGNIGQFHSNNIIDISDT